MAPGIHVMQVLKRTPNICWRCRRCSSTGMWTRNLRKVQFNQAFRQYYGRAAKLNAAKAIILGANENQTLMNTVL